MNTWILVADEANARLFESNKKFRPLSEVEDFINPEARLPGKIFTDDRPTRVQESANSAHHSVEPKTNPHEKHAQIFAKEIVTHLEQARTNNQFDRLILVAGPKFLGRIRAELNGELSKLVCATVDKNITKDSSEQIHEKIVPYL